MDPSTFDYLTPSGAQLRSMDELRKDFTQFCAVIDLALPDGPDKTYVLRLLRTASMWCNVAISRHPDGAPRTT